MHVSQRLQIAILKVLRRFKVLAGMRSRTKEADRVDHHIVDVVQRKCLHRGVPAPAAHQVHPNLHDNDSTGAACSRLNH
jgi:hypothetical protein